MVYTALVFETKNRVDGMNGNQVLDISVSKHLVSLAEMAYPSHKCDYAIPLP
jgi:hypothetical protein